MYAVVRGDLNAVDELIRQGANIRKCEDCDRFYKGHTVLGEAVRKSSGSDAIVLRLLAAGAPVEEVDDSGYTPLLQAAEWGNVIMMRTLLAVGANIEARASAGAASVIEGNTPLFLAVEHLDAVQALIEAGANVDAHNTKNETPLSFAVSVGAPVEVVGLLIQHGANVNNVSRWSPNGGSKRTVLMTAAFRNAANSSEITRLLLDSGADPSVLDGRGRTALMIAREMNNDGASQVLKEFQDRKQN
jgi:ankyrin repeat protein